MEVDMTILYALVIATGIVGLVIALSILLAIFTDL
jgi:hypothetical protein